jgi:flavin-dependent dehydrogenase
VTVLGAGPAGSTAALFLADAGVEVELIDRASFPRDKPCAGGLFNPGRYLEEFPYIEDAGGTFIHRIAFHAGGRAAVHESKLPLFKTTLRRDFDHFLLKKAVKRGARFRVWEAADRAAAPGASGLPPGGGPPGRVIDARGARRPGDYPACGVCLVRDFETDGDCDTVHVHYGFMGIKGYCWVFPKKGYANVGVGAYLPRGDVKEVFRRYLELLTAEGCVCLRGGGGDRARPSGALIPFAPRRRSHAGGTLFAGDAAGFVSPSTGEGIYFAMLSGKIAARAVVEKRPPSWYESECRRAFGRFLKPVRFGRSTALLNRVLETAVGVCARDARFAAMIAENYSRLGEHALALPFVRGLLLRR